LVSSLPNIFEPLEYTTDDVTVCTTRVWAVIVLFTRRLDAVAFCLITKSSADDAVSALIAQLAVPYKDPVILGAISEPVTCTSVFINLVVPGPVTSKEPDTARPGLVGMILIPTLSLK
jgi:hypothetical protein